MTDFFGSLLTQMSSAFNQPRETNDDIELKLTEDKTLKWRGLHNNQFASAKNRSKTYKSENGLDDDGMTEQQQQQLQQQSNQNEIFLSEQNEEKTDKISIEENVDIKLIDDKTKEENDKIIEDYEEKSEQKNGNNEIEIKKINENFTVTDNDKLNNEEYIDNTKLNGLSNVSIENNKKEKTPKIKQKKQEKYERVLRRKTIVDGSTVQSTSIINVPSSNTTNDNEIIESNDDKINQNDNQIPKKISPRKKTKPDNSSNLELDTVSSVEQTKDKPKIEETLNDTKTKRGRKKKNEEKINENTDHNEIKDNKPIEHEDENIIKTEETLEKSDEIKDELKSSNKKIKTNKKSINKQIDEVVLNNQETISSQENENPVEQLQPPLSPGKFTKVPKKRGRKPKSQISNKTNDDENFETKVRINLMKSPMKKSQRITKDSSVLASAIARKEKIYEQVAAQTHQRFTRRIKPTAKILANEELRLGFAYQNSSRLSFSSENQEHEEHEIKDEEIHKKSPNEEVENLIILNEKQPSPPQITSPSSSSIQIKDQSIDSNLDLNQITPKLNEIDELKSPARKPCPDPETFLNEIKSQKIGLNRSPEDNKKLNKKQQRRLYKLKEKHLAKLGLKKTSKLQSTFSDSEELSDDNEEFVPNRKINIPEKPSVTLRMRNQSNLSSNEIQNQTVFRKRKLNVKTDTMKSSSSSSSSKQITPKKHKIIETQKLEITKKNSEQNHHQNNHQSNLKSHHNSSQAIESSQNFICLCDKKSQYYVRKTQELMQCVAIDQIENHHIGCSNEIVDDLINLMRPSSRVSYMILCESHRKRLLAHNCCAGCGIFCSQGMFAMCPSNHLFHRDCATKYILNTPFDPNNTDHFTGPTLAFKCPHCGLDATREDYKLTIKCRESSVFIPQQLKRAKMVFASDNCSNNSVNYEKYQNSHIDVEKIIPKDIFDIIHTAENNLTQSSLNFTTKDLFYAIHNDNIERVAEIIASGFDITTSFREFQNGTCLHLVAGLGSVTMAYLILCKTATKYFLDLMDNELRTALMCAVAAEKHEILKILIRCGADVGVKGTDGMTALHLAAKRGDLISTKIILDSYRVSSSVTKFKSLIDSVDDGNWTALVWAAEHGHSDIVSYLINLGANANICDNENNTALHWAALSDRIDTVLPLLQSNCDFNIQNINGDTPLHISCRQSNTQISLIFLSRGADLNIKNILDETPYDSIPDENSQCGRALKFNILLRHLINHPKRKVISHDISNGREKYPIQIVINVKDNLRNDCEDEIDLPDFKYITKTILLQNSLQIDQRISQMRICTCTDDCSSDDCQCSLISLQNWYNCEGRLKDDFNYEDPAMIFECNDVCGCNKLLCKNRVVQSGIKCRLQVFESLDQVKGWGVQTLTKIFKGSFVAEYTGEILTDAEADRRTDDSYFFDLGSVDHCIDANFYGNVSRFFNHSCNPNVVPVRVYYEHQDLRFPKIAFFASRDIEAGEEITFDYGDKFWIVKFKNFTCHCNAVECKYSKTTISKTLEEYNQRNSSCIN